MKKWILIGLFVFCALLIAFLIIKNTTNENGVKITEDIANYNTKEYPIPQTIFPATPPANAQVISFSYYNYWHEAEDIFLELKFKTPEELLAYVAEIKQLYATHSINRTDFVETQNIYNPSYSDLFSADCVTIAGEEKYTGYTIERENHKTGIYQGYFEVVSFSLQDLVVIHSRVRCYQISAHTHTPIYWKRFDVPLQNNHKRIFYFTSPNGNNRWFVE